MSDFSQVQTTPSRLCGLSAVLLLTAWLSAGAADQSMHPDAAPPTDPALAAAPEAVAAPPAQPAAAPACHSALANGSTAAAAATNSPVTGTFVDYFTNFGRYMPRTHCMINADGTPDWPWIIGLIVLTSTVIVGYLRIFAFWRRNYLSEEERDRNRKLMELANIFLWCAVCGYAMSLVSFFWPAYRLLALFLAVLNFFTWRFATSLSDFKVSLSARRLQRELEESLQQRADRLEEEVRRRTAELSAKNEQLAASEQRFNQMVANVPGMVYRFERTADGAHRFSYASDGAFGVFGYTAQQVVDDPQLLLPNAIHADDLPGLREAIDASASTGAYFEWEGRVYDEAGRERQVQARSQPHRDADGGVRWDGIVIDVTESRQATLALENARQEARKLALVAANTSNAVVITDPQGYIEWVNEGFTRITGYSYEEAIGRKPGSFLQGERTDPQVVAQIRHAVAQAQPIEVELINYGKTGREYWLRVEIQPVRNEQGAVTNFIAIESDITHAKQAEQELARARDAANAANQAKSAFLANISHEIRTPLGAVIGFSEMLQRDLNAPERPQWVATIHRSAQHLLTLINDVLDFSKIEAGRMEFERIECSPHELLAEVASIMRVPAREKGLDLSLRCRTSLPALIQTDPTRLRQVLLNLVSNAIKFTEQGGIRLVAALEEDGPEPRFCVDVADTGIGMTDEQQQRIFQPFSQADNSMTRRFGGTGLGLAISKHICEGLGGGLALHSRPGVGSTFTVRVQTGELTNVPRINAEEAIAQFETTQPVPLTQEDSQALAGRHLLVVDDGQTNRQLISLYLRRAGAEVTCAEHGEDALAQLQRHPHFDLILLDMQMPRMDGYTAAGAMRQRGYAMPIVALTAHAMSGDRERCLAAGCDEYMTKPITGRKLISCVQQLLGMAAAPASAAASGRAPDAAPATGLTPLCSELPMDDAEFADIVRCFVDTARSRFEDMRHAVEAAEYRRLADLAHWLKGSGGSAGFPAFCPVAQELEQAALHGNLQAIESQLLHVRQLIERSAAGLAPAVDAPSTLTQRQ